MGTKSSTIAELVDAGTTLAAERKAIFDARVADKAEKAARRIEAVTGVTPEVAEITKPRFDSEGTEAVIRYEPIDGVTFHLEVFTRFGRVLTNRWNLTRGKDDYAYLHRISHRSVRRAIARLTS